jgi:hypothetical protein
VYLYSLLRYDYLLKIYATLVQQTKEKNKPYYMSVRPHRISISHIIHSVKLRSKLRCSTCFCSFNSLAGSDGATYVYFLDVDTHHTHIHTLMHAQRYTYAHGNPTEVLLTSPPSVIFNLRRTKHAFSAQISDYCRNTASSVSCVRHQDKRI